MYGKVDETLVHALRACVSSDAGVLWAGDAHRFEGGAEQLRAASRDQSFHEAHAVEVMVTPRDVEEVQRVVRLCAQRLIPITPRGAGTGIEGAAIPYAGGLVLCTVPNPNPTPVPQTVEGLTKTPRNCVLGCPLGACSLGGGGGPILRRHYKASR